MFTNSCNAEFLIAFFLFYNCFDLWSGFNVFCYITVKSVSASGVGSSRTIYEMRCCASNHSVCTSERSGYLAVIHVGACPIHPQVHFSSGQKARIVQNSSAFDSVIQDVLSY